MNMKKYFDAANAAEARVQTIAAQINDLFEKGQTEDAVKMRPQLDAAKAEAKEAHQLYLSMAAATTPDGDPAQRFVPTGGEPEPKAVKDMRASNEYMTAFFDALKAGVSPKTIKNGQHRAEPYQILMATLTETGGSPAGEDGGFLLPVDFDNKINELKRKFFDLAQYFNVETVTAYTGWRVVEQAAAALGFAAITEDVALAEMEQPKFDKMTYTIVDYGGYLPVSNDLMSDTPVNIMNYLAGWVAKKIALTNTTRLLIPVNAISPTAVATTDDRFAAIKTALNITLDPVISAGANIFTNQKGFDLLDQELDGEGRPILQPDPSAPTSYRLMGRPVVVVPTTQWANMTSTDRARMAIGDGKQFCTLFRRSPLEMASSNIGGDAWRKNNTEVRAIYRIDEVAMDASAMVLLTLAF
jgi:HK97 family phage major capsid protein